ncbi:MAG: response regulator [Deltaproteobacteria bacterium]|nr:MAG: response regulator [Deltaproteobacteria bacterium]
MPRKILIVDDEPDAISFISSVLEDSGYAYISAENGVEGLELARKVKPDMILLDLIMPGKSGIIMFQELKKDPELGKIPVIVVSGASEALGVDFKDFMFKQPLRREGKAGETSGETSFTEPNAYVEKPVDPRELIKVIKENLKD